MNGYLLDTHVLLWWLSEPTRLSPEAAAIIRDGRNRLWVSSAAIWEMSIKKSLGRLDMPPNLAEVLQTERIGVLSVNLVHALSVQELPWLHRDPFDRMQVVQALREDLVLMTRDSQMQQYGVECLLV